MGSIRQVTSVSMDGKTATDDDDWEENKRKVLTSIAEVCIRNVSNYQYIFIVLMVESRGDYDYGVSSPSFCLFSFCFRGSMIRFLTFFAFIVPFFFFFAN